MDIFFRKHFSSLYSFITTLFFRLGIVAHLSLNFISKIFHAVRLPLLDILLIAASMTVAVWIRFPSDFLEGLRGFFPILGAYALIYLLFLGLGGSYRKAKQYDFVRAAVNLFPGFLFNGFLTFFILRSAQSRLIFLISFSLMMLLLPLWRIAGSRRRSKHFQEHSEAARRTLVVGAGQEGMKIAATLGKHPELGYLFVGFADKELTHPKTIGSTSDLSLLIRTRQIDHVIFSSDVFSLSDIISMMAELAHFPISIKIIPEKENMIFGKMAIENIDDIPVIEMEYAILRPIWRISKRIIDLIIAIVGIIILTPFAFISKWVSGSHRVAFSEDVKNGFIWQTRKNGRWPFLYWYPMLFPLLMGNMTIVGDLKIIPEGSKRYYKPGMTSIMRSEKPAQPTPEEHERFIHYYMSNFSFVLDVEIIFKTLFLNQNK